MTFKVPSKTILKIACLLGFMWLLSIVKNKLELAEKARMRQLDSDIINQFLLERDEIMNSSHPILWVHIKREKTSSVTDVLNKPYLYLTVRSIINACSSSFQICIVDDNTFAKLIPNWKINVDSLSDPILRYVRTLGMLNLLFLYGGLICPSSFVCQHNLESMYLKNTVVMCKKQSELPNLEFMSVNEGKNETIGLLIKYMEELISKDNTNESLFLDRPSKQCQKYVVQGKIALIDGEDIGIMKPNKTVISIDELMSPDYLELKEPRYGILIPDDELSKRTKYNWFIHVNEKEILMSDIAISKQLLLTLGDDLVDSAQIKQMGVANITQNISIKDIEDNKNRHVGYWDVPSGAPVWGLKPIRLGNDISKTT